MRFLRIVFIHTSQLQQKYINIYFFQLDFVSKINCTKCSSAIMITQKAKSTPKTTFKLSKTTQKSAAYRMSDVKSLIYKNLRRLKIRTKDFQAKQL